MWSLLQHIFNFKAWPPCPLKGAHTAYILMLTHFWRNSKDLTYKLPERRAHTKFLVCFWYVESMSEVCTSIPVAYHLRTLNLPFGVGFGYGKRYEYGIFLHILLVTWLHTKYVSETYLAFGPLTVCFWYAIRYAFGMCAIPFSIPLHTLYLPFEVCFWYGKRYGFGIFFAYTFGHLVAYQIHIRNIPCLCFCFDHKYGMFLVCYYRYAFGMCAIPEQYQSWVCFRYA